MQKIVPHLWFDKRAKEAAGFYASLFPDSKVDNVMVIHDTPSGDCDVVSFTLAGQAFLAISAGPAFRFNPAISFLVKCDTKEEVDSLWHSLSDGGTALMELGAYPFSERYGWIQDRHGLSWQVMLTDGKQAGQKIVPFMMFVGEVCGKAEEAINFYVSLFRNSRVMFGLRYGRDETPDKEGTLKYAAFTLEGQEFSAMDSAHAHRFAFNEAISFLVRCDSQQEIDDYWGKLSALPASEQCGWLKDKYGVSWQISAAAMDELMGSGDRQKTDRVTQAFLKMKKLDLAALRRAYEGK